MRVWSVVTFGHTLLPPTGFCSSEILWFTYTSKFYCERCKVFSESRNTRFFFHQEPRPCLSGGELRHYYQATRGHTALQPTKQECCDRFPRQIWKLYHNDARDTEYKGSSPIYFDALSRTLVFNGVNFIHQVSVRTSSFYSSSKKMLIFKFECSVP